MKFAKFSRTSFFTEHLRWLLLNSSIYKIFVKYFAQRPTEFLRIHSFKQFKTFNIIQKNVVINKKLERWFLVHKNESLVEEFIELRDISKDHCVKSVQIGSYFWSDTGKYGPEIIAYLDTFHAMDMWVLILGTF